MNRPDLAHAASYNFERLAEFGEPLLPATQDSGDVVLSSVHALLQKFNLFSCQEHDDTKNLTATALHSVTAQLHNVQEQKGSTAPIYSILEAFHVATGLPAEFFDEVLRAMPALLCRAQDADTPPALTNSSSDFNKDLSALVVAIKVWDKRRGVPECLLTNRHINWVRGSVVESCAGLRGCHHQVKDLECFPVQAGWLRTGENLYQLAKAYSSPTEFTKHVLSLLDLVGDEPLNAPSSFPAPEDTILVPAPESGASVEFVARFTKGEFPCQHDASSWVEISLQGFVVSSINGFVPKAAVQQMPLKKKKRGREAEH